MLGKPIAAIAFALLLGSAWAQGLEMQVEEPGAMVSPPIDPVQDAASWQAKKVSPALNPAQKAALEERRKMVEQMTSELREKREALENTGLEGKAALVKQLESIILETGNGAAALEKLEDLAEKKAAIEEKNLAKRVEQMEKKLEKAIEKGQEKPDKSKDGGNGKSNSSKSGK